MATGDGRVRPNAARSGCVNRASRGGAGREGSACLDRDEREAGGGHVDRPAWRGAAA
jgi:hypothetical protein